MSQHGMNLATLHSAIGDAQFEVYVDEGGEHPELTLSVRLTGGGKVIKLRQHFPVTASSLREFAARLLVVTDSAKT